MSALTAAAFAALLATCAPSAPANYLTGIARTESRLEPYALHDNATDHAIYPETRESAIAMARELLEQGHSIDVGLLQVNNRNWAWLGLTVETALDPCRNLAAGARVFEAFSRYNTGDPQRGYARGYVQRVIANLRAMPSASAAIQAPHHDPPLEPYDLGGGDDPSLATTYEGN
jgi:type IV secretion system protein VirB1